MDEKLGDPIDCFNCDEGTINQYHKDGTTLNVMCTNCGYMVIYGYDLDEVTAEKLKKADGGGEE